MVTAATLRTIVIERIPTGHMYFALPGVPGKIQQILRSHQFRNIAEKGCAFLASDLKRIITDTSLVNLLRLQSRLGFLKHQVIQTTVPVILAASTSKFGICHIICLSKQCRIQSQPSCILLCAGIRDQYTPAFFNICRYSRLCLSKRAAAAKTKHQNIPLI